MSANFVRPGPGHQSSQGGVATRITPEEAMQERAARLRQLGLPELMLTIRRAHPEAAPLTDATVPGDIAELVAMVSKLEEAEGGRGVVLVLDGSREEQDRLVLRLLPKLADAGTGARFAKVVESLNVLTREARQRVAVSQDAGFDTKSNELVSHIEDMAFATKG